jgi:hypothetical protein
MCQHCIKRMVYQHGICAYFDLVHIADCMIEFHRSALLHTMAIDHDILAGKWRSSTRGRRNRSSHGRATRGCGNSILELVYAVLLLPVHSLLLLLASDVHGRNVGTLHSWTNIASARAHHHLARLRSIGAVCASHALAAFLTTKRTWLRH